MKWIKDIISWLYGIKTDKLLHFLMGMVIAQVTAMLFRRFCPSLDYWSHYYGFLVSVGVSGLKELVDVFVGVPSMYDFFAGCAGAFCGIAILLI